MGAPAIIGSAQGRYTEDVAREKAMDWLCEALSDLGSYAQKLGATLLLEPLNRYETNLINRVDQGMEALQKVALPNIKLLGDLFHMNIEETNSAQALRSGAAYLGHVHLADSNRGPCGSGHIGMEKIGEVLKDIGYQGFVSAECLPTPDSSVAAEMTMKGFQRHFSHKPPRVRSVTA